ncbi:hypothetical protein HPB47_021120 [Ixodes persulcatus]|uniref:Uncharacterized protein n=1 Tax=Ixodes persulcatus TaxID=34615 RepID=A0AC60QGQ7_IXOPE|nr:hypothetical protein HPB47_021120 [Ixodes persulcatus]
MDQRGPPVTLRPPMFDPGGTTSVTFEAGVMDTALSLSPEIEGTNTQAANTGTTTATSGPITEGIQSMLTQETLGKLGQIEVDGREEGKSQLQGTQPAGLQTHQRLPPPEVSQLFQVLAGVIERQPAILEALQQFVARFVSLPQEVLNDPPQHKHRDPRQYPRSRENNDRSRSPRRPTTGNREAESYQEVQQMEDDGRFPSANPKPQDDGWASEAGASTYSTSQGPTPGQSVPSAPLTATSVSQTDDDQEWPLPGASSQIRKRSPPATEKNDKSIPGSLPVQTVVLRCVGKKEVGAFTGKEIRDAIQHAGIHAQADYSVHRNERANALSITTRDPNITEKLMTIKEIRKGDEDNTFQPYKALAGNECRGVVYLRDAEELKRALTSLHKEPQLLAAEASVDCQAKERPAAEQASATTTTAAVTPPARIAGGDHVTLPWRHQAEMRGPL